MGGRTGDRTRRFDKDRTKDRTRGSNWGLDWEVELGDRIGGSDREVGLGGRIGGQTGGRTKVVYLDVTCHDDVTTSQHDKL